MVTCYNSLRKLDICCLVPKIHGRKKFWRRYKLIFRVSRSAIHASTSTFISLGEHVLKPVMNPNDDAGTSYDEP